MLEILKVLLLSFLEGATEFLPISSTGHMIVVEYFIKLSDNRVFVEAFQIIIQLGAILSVVVVYWDKLFPFQKNIDKEKRNDIILLWTKVIVAIIPIGILGFLFDDIVEEYLFNPLTVAYMLIVYGILFIIVEKVQKKVKYESIKELKYSTAILVGLFQCLAMVPGTSRSGATILGALLLGLSRVLATEFSFFLAIPTMLGVTLIKILKVGFVLSTSEYLLILLGLVLSFAFAYIFIRLFISYIKKHDFKIFAYYRIILGIILLVIFFR